MAAAAPLGSTALPKGRFPDVSFDLCVFPSPAPATAEEVYRLIEEREERLMAGEPEPDPDPSPAMGAFLARLEADWGSLKDEHTDRVPWAFWPLWQPTGGGGTILNIVWSRAEPMRAAVIKTAGRYGLTVFDPQEEVVVPPRPVPRWRNWLGKREPRGWG